MSEENDSVCANFRARMQNEAQKDGTTYTTTYEPVDLNLIYEELDALLFLSINIADAGLTEIEKQTLNKAIIQRIEILMKHDEYGDYLTEFQDTEFPKLEDCLPEGLKSEQRERAPKEYKEKLEQLHNRFKNMSVKEKLKFLGDEASWSIRDDGKGNVIVIVDSEEYHKEHDWRETDKDVEEFERELNKNFLFTALEVLNTIIEKEQSQQK